MPETGFVSQNGEPIAAEAFRFIAAEASYVLIGESHSNACDHRTQARVLGLLAESGRPPAVGFEMVAVDLQSELDAFNAGALAIAELPERLRWEDRWGFDFAIYEPVFQAAAAHSLDTYALNLPPALVRRISAEGVDALNDKEQALLPERIIEPPEEALERIRAAFEAHPDTGEEGEDPETRFQRFVTIQSLWDTMMAERAVEIRRETGRPVAVIAGSAHATGQGGVAHRLRILDPGASILQIAPWRGEAEFPLEGGDVFAYCPLTHRSRLGMVLKQAANVVSVVEVAPGSRAAEAGLLAGDVVVEAMGEPIDALGDIHVVGFTARKEDAPFVLTIERAGRELAIDFGRLATDADEPGSEAADPQE